MTKKLLTVLAVGLLAAAPSMASAQISTSISLAGGLSMPSGDFESGKNIGYGVKSGYNLAAGLNIGVPLLPVGVRAEVGYNSFDVKNLGPGETATQNITSATVNGTFGLGLPYVIGGLGYYSTKGQAKDASGTFNTERENTLGFNAGVGLRFPLGVISTFAEIRYHKMMGNDNALSANKPAANVAYIPITFGINF
jgi:hypothetical protein